MQVSMADIIEVVRVIPQYSVVDLNKKRKNRSISANVELSDSCATVDQREYSVVDLNKKRKNRSISAKLKLSDSYV